MLESQHNYNIQIHEKNMDEVTSRKTGYYFYHKNYSKPKNISYFVTFDNTGGRFGNQLFRYVTSKLFTVLFGHKYISREQVPDNSDFIIINESNIKYIHVSHPTLPELGAHGIKRNVCEGD